MKTLFEKSISIQFGDVDSAGVLYFSNIFDLAHRFVENYIQSKSLYDLWFQNPDLAAPIVHAAADFKLPLKLGDVVNLTLERTEISTHSVKLYVRFYKEAVLCAEVQTVHVFIDKNSGQKTAVPLAILDSLKI